MKGFRLKPPQPSENDVEAGCRTLLGLHRYLMIRLHAGVFRTLDGGRVIQGVPRGTPDYACLHEHHRAFLLEVKRPGGELNENQERQLFEIRRIYNLAIAVVESTEELSAFLRAHEQPP
jgi:hypothetical protein